MTDAEVLGRYRNLRISPYMSLRTARALHHLDLKNRHIGVAAATARQEALEEERRQLRALVTRRSPGQAPMEPRPSPRPNHLHLVA
jgi:hypothetical protein